MRLSPFPLGCGAIQAGVLLLGQSLALWAYTAHTARSHELPWPLARVVGMAASLLGIDVAVHGSTLAMHSMREFFDDAGVHYLGATWELFLDPATLAFFVGGWILLGMIAWGRPPAGQRWPAWIGAIRVFTLIVIAWLPLRAALLIAFYLHRVLRANPAVPLTAMNQFFSPWVALACLAAPVLLAWRLLCADGKAAGASRTDATEPAEPIYQAAREARASLSPSARQRFWPNTAGLALIACAAALVAFFFQWDPVGRPKGGRVMFVERHSTWEPSDRPYDKDHFGHDPSYSYTRIYDYLGQYFEMSRLGESDPIDRRKLSQCDVLVVKIPTARFLPGEVTAVTQFVAEGGGLLLVGDHTNVFKSSTYLNDLARPFGFTFRHDLLFAIGSPYIQRLDPPRVPHPAVQHLPPMHYAVSCSVDPGRSLGRALVRQTGLWSLPPDYHAENFHPEAKYRPEMAYGAFIQLWSTRHGRGRVLAFTDSTIFSNFCTFQPGKAELMLGMIDWLNRTSPLDPAGRRVPLAFGAIVAALAMLAGGFACKRKAPAPFSTLVVFAAGVFGAMAGSAAVVATNRAAMPQPSPLRPMTCVVVDRTVSEAPLSLGADTEGDGRGYGLLEQWISRLGCYTVRRSGAEAFSGEALVVICPTRSVPEAFQRGLVDYVARGGRLLVIDSPDSMGTTANTLLWPFGMSVSHAAAKGGTLKLASDWPGIKVEAACQIAGGKPLMWVDDLPVAARARYGQGSVMAIGFGSVLNDTAMGGHWMLTPDKNLFTRAELDPELMKRYDVLFGLLETLLHDEPLAVPAAPPAEKSE